MLPVPLRCVSTLSSLLVRTQESSTVAAAFTRDLRPSMQPGWKDRRRFAKFGTLPRCDWQMRVTLQQDKMQGDIL